MKSKGRRLSVQEKVESKRSGVPRLRVLFALFAALLVIGVAVGCGDDDSSSDSASGGTSGGASTTAKDAAKSGDQTVSAGVSDYADYVGAKSSGARQQQVADHHRLGQPGGRPDRRRPRLHQGRRPRRQVPQREAGRHRRSSRQAVQLLHLDVRGAGSDLRPEDGQRQGRQGHRHGRGRHRRPVPGRDRRTSKPMVSSVAIGAADAKNKNGFGLFGDGVWVSGPFATFAPGPQGQEDRRRLARASRHQRELAGDRRGSKAPGMEVKRSRWNPNATDLVGPLTAAGAQTADVIIQHGPEGLREPGQGAAA